MDNVTQEHIIQLIEDMGNEIIYFASIGEYEKAETAKKELDSLINDLQN